MELNDIILGFLDWKELTGYELKAMFNNLVYLPWSGNNNQIYTSLVDLERRGMVSKQTILQEKLPAQKRYSTTDEGRKRLKEAIQSPVDMLNVKNDFLLHLVWSECLTQEELLRLVDGYQSAVETELAMCREKKRREPEIAARGKREAYLHEMIAANKAMVLQSELNWLAMLRNGLANL